MSVFAGGVILAKLHVARLVAVLARTPMCCPGRDGAQRLSTIHPADFRLERVAEPVDSWSLGAAACCLRSA